jgi:hypothetical protein
MLNPLYPNPSVEQPNGDDFYRCPICNQANISLTYYARKRKGFWGLRPACSGYLILVCGTCTWKGVSWNGEVGETGKRKVETCERRP